MLDQVARRYGVTPAHLLRLSPQELTVTLRCAELGFKRDPPMQCPLLGGRGRG